jgi:hypothetical protein
MVSKDSKKIVVNRPFYDPTIREAIEGGDLAHMKHILEQAKAVYAEQGDLKRAISRLELAIKAAE